MPQNPSHDISGLYKCLITVSHIEINVRLICHIHSNTLIWIILKLSRQNTTMCIIDPMPMLVVTSVRYRSSSGTLWHVSEIEMHLPLESYPCIRGGGGGWGYWTKFWRGCAAGERQNPPMSKGVEPTRQAPCLRKLSPWRPICMDPHPKSYHLPCPASHYSNHQMVIALLCKYIQCQLPQLSISGCQTR